MASLISPGVSVTIDDQSFFIPGRAATIPVIFIATADEKTQPDGVTPALGTYEYGVFREVTSIRQAVELYGIPRYLESVDGQPFHGDARNEYGLDALNKFLEVGNRAYVVRANVNLDDSITGIRALWGRKISEASDYVCELFEDYLAEFNEENELYGPAASTEVAGSDAKLLIEEALTDLFNVYSFSSKNRTGNNNLFKQNFLEDNNVARSGYQEIVFDTTGGFLTTDDVTGLNNDATTYAFTISIEGAVPQTVSLDGAAIQTFGELIDEINTELGGDAFIDFVAGRLRVTSALSGATSSIEIEEGVSGATGLFSSLNLFLFLADPVQGLGTDQLLIFADGYENAATGDYFGLYNAIDDSSSYTCPEIVALLSTAANEYELTREFRNFTSLGINDAERRAEIVAQMQAAINDPTLGVRNPDAYSYNLLVAPGYHELTDELNRMAVDMLEEVFVIGETPFDRPPTGFNGITTWALSSERTTYPGAAYYYGHGISSNLDGINILTTSASTALRVYAFNDRETALWYAPAGVERGSCPHLTKTGYVSGNLGGPTTFVEEDLNVGARDSLYEFPKNINPITRISGRGILVLGQKTVYGAVSLRESVNIERLLRYIKREVRRGLFPYLFEPNDQITRDQVKTTVDNFLFGLINTRALFDFATICDDSNNTPDRVQRKELWIDVALKPVTAVEFIPVTIRVVALDADIGDPGSIIANPPSNT